MSIEGDLKSFTAFCKAHPELRFFQALLAWVQENKHTDAAAILIKESDGPTIDTFYWE